MPASPSLAIALRPSRTLFATLAALYLGTALVVLLAPLAWYWRLVLGLALLGLAVNSWRGWRRVSGVSQLRLDGRQAALLLDGHWVPAHLASPLVLTYYLQIVTLRTVLGVYRIPVLPDSACHSHRHQLRQWLACRA